MYKETNRTCMELFKTMQPKINQKHTKGICSDGLFGKRKKSILGLSRKFQQYFHVLLLLHISSLYIRYSGRTNTIFFLQYSEGRQDEGRGETHQSSICILSHLYITPLKLSYATFIICMY